MIKRIFRFIALMLIFSCMRNAAASHMMGTDMYYVCLGGGKYKIIAKVYRDCRGIAFNGPSFGVFAGTAGGNSCGGYDYSSAITRTAIIDVSQKCDTAKSKCNPVNTGGTGEGVEMHVYEVTVDFNTAPLNNFVGKSSCCDVTFWLGQCCRNGAITTGPAGNDFYTTCTINICNIGTDCNNSPTFSNIPIFFACCNQPYRFNHGITETDGDSVAFHIIPGVQTLPNTSVTYSSPFSYQYPVTPFCTSATIKCTPDPNANPPVGFYFDGENGDMVYTPTRCDEVGVIAVEAIEYRKISGMMREIGRVRRDMQVIVENCAENMVPQISANPRQCVQEGDSLCFTISTLDSLVQGQSSGDSLKMDWNSGIPGATFKIIQGGKNPVAQFCWKVPKGASRGLAYNFSVNVSDNNCPRVAKAYKGISVYVGNCDRFANVRPVQANESKNPYPMPVNAGDVLHIPGSDFKMAAYAIYDLQGREVCSGTVSSSGTIRIPETLHGGVYVLKCQNNGKYFHSSIQVSR